MLRELSTKRIGFDKAAFVKTSADLLPVLCQAWDAQWALIEGPLSAVAAGNVPPGDSEAGVRAAEAISLGTVCVKVGWRWCCAGALDADTDDWHRGDGPTRSSVPRANPQFPCERQYSGMRDVVGAICFSSALLARFMPELQYRFCIYFSLSFNPSTLPRYFLPVAFNHYQHPVSSWFHFSMSWWDSLDG